MLLSHVYVNKKLKKVNEGVKPDCVEKLNVNIQSDVEWEVATAWLSAGVFIF